MPAKLLPELASCLSSREDLSKKTAACWDSLDPLVQLEQWPLAIQRAYRRFDKESARVLWERRPEGSVVPVSLIQIAFRPWLATLDSQEEPKYSQKVIRWNFTALVDLFFENVTDMEIHQHRWPPHFAEEVFRGGAGEVLKHWRRVDLQGVERGHVCRRLLRPVFKDLSANDWSCYGFHQGLAAVLPSEGVRRQWLTTLITNRALGGWSVEQSKALHAQLERGEPLSSEQKSMAPDLGEWFSSRLKGLRQADALVATPLACAVLGGALEKALEAGPRESAWLFVSTHVNFFPKGVVETFFNLPTARQWGEVSGAYLATYAMTTSMSQAFSLLRLVDAPRTGIFQGDWTPQHTQAWAEGFCQAWGEKPWPEDWGTPDREGFLGTLKSTVAASRLEQTLGAHMGTQRKSRM